ncbi:MAG: hypothetical protein QM731_16325 [Chitinophagaceae bacterium]
MKRLIPFTAVLLLLFSFSCKKLIDKKKEDLLVDAITNGVWVVEQYKAGENDITSDFTGYEFRFSENGTVTGTKESTISNGTWTGDIDSRSITALFPSAGDPLIKLNGTWLLTDTYWDYVEASMTVSSVTYQLHLRKKS